MPTVMEHLHAAFALVDPDGNLLRCLEPLRAK